MEKGVGEGEIRDKGVCVQREEKRSEEDLLAMLHYSGLWLGFHLSD